MTVLYPEGCDRTADIPYHLQSAISRALIVLSWEELPDEDRPPRRIWKDDEALTAWFDQIKADRKREAGGGPGPIEDPVENAAARNLIIG